MSGAFTRVGKQILANDVHYADAADETAAEYIVRRLGGWQPIESAPKDGAELLGYREDCGVLLMRWTSLGEFLTEVELYDIDEDAAYAEDWFYADFVSGGRLEGDEGPTHWMPLPPAPVA